MAWRCHGSTNTELVENLFRAGLIKDERVKKAMLGVDRAHYTTSNPYQDRPQSIGFAATISAPHMHAYATEYLLPLLFPASNPSNSDPTSSSARANPNIRILDIGSGSGYLTHVLATLIAPPDRFPSGAKVIGIDHIEGLVSQSRSNISKSASGRSYLSNGTIELICGDGRKGYAEGGPYDAIHVGAAAKEMHGTLVEQLKAPGRMFIPVEDGEGEQFIWVVDKDEKGVVKEERIMGVRYVPLTDRPDF